MLVTSNMAYGSHQLLQTVQFPAIDRTHQNAACCCSSIGKRSKQNFYGSTDPFQCMHVHAHSLGKSDEGFCGSHGH